MNCVHNIRKMWLCNGLRGQAVVPQTVNRYQHKFISRCHWWYCFVLLPVLGHFLYLHFMCAYMCGFDSTSEPGFLSFNSTNLYIHMMKSFNCFYDILPFCFLLYCSLLSSGRNIHFIFVSGDPNVSGSCNLMSNADCNEFDVNLVQHDVISFYLLRQMP